MRNDNRSGRSIAMWALVLLLGAAVGGWIGAWLSGLDLPAGIKPLLRWEWRAVSISELTVDLYVLKLSLGAAFRLNIMSLVGLLVTALVARKR